MNNQDFRILYASGDSPVRKYIPEENRCMLRSRLKRLTVEVVILRFLG